MPQPLSARPFITVALADANPPLIDLTVSIGAQCFEVTATKKTP